MIEENGKSSAREKRKAFLRTILLVSISILTLGAIVLPSYLEKSTYSLQAGDVAPHNIVAPYSHTYTSQVLTNEAVEKARQSIQPIYLPADPEIARTQLENLRTTLAYISDVRADSFASQQQKQDDLANLADLTLEEEPA
ncbi:MAG: hypothetical protein AAGU25_05070, partial [bacterium]